jgi:hypothetical protein
VKEQIEKCIACRASHEREIHWECLPVPAFGNPCNSGVRVATIAINPAQSEFFNNGTPKIKTTRLPMLVDYAKACRVDLGPSELKDARERRDYYFCDAQKNPRSFYHPWFDPLENILLGLCFGWSYFNATAIHFDLVACATRQPWRYVPNPAQEVLQLNCRQYFQETLSQLPEGTILLSNGVEPKDIPVDVEFSCEVVELKDLPPLSVWQGSLSRYGNRILGWKPSISSLWPNLWPEQKAPFLQWLRQHCHSQIRSGSGRQPETAGPAQFS